MFEKTISNNYPSILERPQEAKSQSDQGADGNEPGWRWRNSMANRKDSVRPYICLLGCLLVPSTTFDEQVT